MAKRTNSIETTSRAAASAMCAELPPAPTPYELAAAWAEEENQNFAMLEAAEKMVSSVCPAASSLLKLVMDRMRDCVPEEDLLNRLGPKEVAHG